MLGYNITKTVILFLLLVLFCIPENVYCQVINVENMYIYLDKKELDITDKKLTLKIKSVRNDYVEIKGKYDNTHFYSKVYSGMFKELDSLKISLNSRTKKKNYVTVMSEIYNENYTTFRRMSVVEKCCNYSWCHSLTFYYTRKTETEQSEE